MLKINKISKFFTASNKIIQNTKINIYNGATFDISKVLEEDSNQSSFSDVLDNTLSKWSKDNIRSITVKIEDKYSEYIPLFIKRGFYFHHCKENYLVLCKWIDAKTNNKIPNYAHHAVGIGACIINSNMEFLLIRETFSPYQKIAPWKFVTGLIDNGENIIDATLREANEEVGIDINYHGCLLVSERYPNNLGISDICFFNLCTVMNNKPLSLDQQEVKEARYFTLEEVQKLLDDNETTELTKHTINKVMPYITKGISLDVLLNKVNLLKASSLKNENIKLYASNYINFYH
jgi:ADP-ribose pyrophosphatase YjhB (NUDIX family)